MSIMKFDFNFANTSCIPLESVKDENKEKAKIHYSKVYEKYSDKINNQNGKILIGYSKDGTQITMAQVECGSELFFEIYSDEKIIQELAKKIVF